MRAGSLHRGRATGSSLCCVRERRVSAADLDDSLFLAGNCHASGTVYEGSEASVTISSYSIRLESGSDPCA